MLDKDFAESNEVLLTWLGYSHKSTVVEYHFSYGYTASYKELTLYSTRPPKLRTVSISNGNYISNFFDPLIQETQFTHLSFLPNFEIDWGWLMPVLKQVKLDCRRKTSKSPAPSLELLVKDIDEGLLEFNIQKAYKAAVEYITIVEEVKQNT